MQIQELLPEDWGLSNLVWLNLEWQVNVTNGEYVVVATGDSISNALDNAHRKIESGEFIGRLFWLERTYREPLSRIDISALLAPTPVRIQRRF